MRMAPVILIATQFRLRFRMSTTFHLVDDAIWCPLLSRTVVFILASLASACRSVAQVPPGEIPPALPPATVSLLPALDDEGTAAGLPTLTPATPKPIASFVESLSANDAAF